MKQSSPIIARRASGRRSLWALRIVLLSAAVSVAAGCSVKTFAVKTVANTLSEPGDTFTRDDDPELIRAALPFGLKTFESLLESVPTHKPLLIATCSGFTSYAYAFVETDADLLGNEDYDKAKALRDQALRLYLRAKGYCWRALEVRFKGISDRLKAEPGVALGRAKTDDVPLLYWSAASLGAAISLAKGRTDLLVDLPIVRALIERALALDEPWGNGSLHELMITIESQGEAFGGSESGAWISDAASRTQPVPLVLSFQEAGHGDRPRELADAGHPRRRRAVHYPCPVADVGTIAVAGPSLSQS